MDRAWLIHAALLGAVVTLARPASSPCCAADEMPPRLTNAPSYADLMSDPGQYTTPPPVQDVYLAPATAAENPYVNPGMIQDAPPEPAYAPAAPVEPVAETAAPAEPAAVEPMAALEGEPAASDAEGDPVAGTDGPIVLPPLPPGIEAMPPAAEAGPGALPPMPENLPASPDATYPAPDATYPAPDAAYPAAPEANYAAPEAAYPAPEVNYAAPEAAFPDPTASAALPAPTDAGVGLVACTTCGGRGHSLHHMGGGVVDAGCTTCGGSGLCVPGRGLCYTPWMGNTHLGRFCANLYECLCCPDPCYQPRWVPEANASFFTDFARPRTITRLRWDRLWDMPFHDRAEFFFAGQKINPERVPERIYRGQFVPIKGGGDKGLAWPPGNARGSGRVPFFGEPSLNFNQIYLYQEAASERASFFVEQIYRSYDPLLGDYEAGFGDLTLGTKAMWLDCELMQLTFQFKTMIPTGAANKGLGTGHVSLEPSLLMSLRLAPETYFQGQLAEWIPISGDTDYAGSILHYHFSFNHVLWRLAPDSPVIGTWEFNGWSFQDGAYTDHIRGPNQFASGETYFSMGPGLRISICDAIDGGLAYAFPVTDGRWADGWLRAELRILY